MAKFNVSFNQEQLLLKHGSTETITELSRMTELSQYVVTTKLKMLGITPLTREQALKAGKISTLPKHNDKYNDHSKEVKTPLVRPPTVYTNKRYIYKAIEEVE